MDLILESIAYKLLGDIYLFLVNITIVFPIYLFGIDGVTLAQFLGDLLR